MGDSVADEPISSNSFDDPVSNAPFSDNLFDNEDNPKKNVATPKSGPAL